MCLPGLPDDHLIQFIRSMNNMLQPGKYNKTTISWSDDDDREMPTDRQFRL